MRAFLTLQEYDEQAIEWFFFQFLAFSADYSMNWTERKMFVAEGLFKNLRATDLVFHRNEIIKNANLSVRQEGE